AHELRFGAASERLLHVALRRHDVAIRRVRPAAHVPLRRGVRADRERHAAAHDRARGEPARRQRAAGEGRRGVDVPAHVRAPERLQPARRRAEVLGRHRVQRRHGQLPRRHRLRLHRRRPARLRAPAVARAEVLMRRVLALLVLASLAAIPLGCGGTFELPTEHPKAIVPTDQSYAMLATWKGMDGVQDLIITQGQGNQLFVLFNHGGSGPSSVPRGEVKLYPLTNPNPIGHPYFEPMRSLFNPVAIAAGRNGLFVLDQGDSCAAKYDVRLGTCEADHDTSNGRIPFRNQIFDYSSTWRVREYSFDVRTAGDTVSTFTDTTVAQPYGIAVDEQGRVYVSCLAVFLDSLQTNKSIRTRKFVSRIY